MNIGPTIKQLRRRHDITQEQLADYLGTSPQAISRWETGVTQPDLAHIPALANIFNVTTDELLGVDIAAKEARIDAICENAITNYKAKGLTSEAIAVLREGLKEYPNSYKLMDALQSALWHRHHSTTTAPC